jgi:hypothetical protein
MILGRKSRDRRMIGYLINKNLCFYYWLRKRIGKKSALRLAKAIERIILFFWKIPILKNPTHLTP